MSPAASTTRRWPRRWAPARRRSPTWLPELRERLPDLPRLPAAPGLDSEHARFPLFDAVATFLRRAAEQTPLVVVLDDLHAADHASLLLLSFVARDLHDAHLLVVGTCREGDGEIDAEPARLLTAIGRAGVRLPLVGWDVDETARFVRTAADVDPPPGLIGHLHDLTDGNPFFVDEIVRLLLAEGGGRLPDDAGAAAAEQHPRHDPGAPAPADAGVRAHARGRGGDRPRVRPPDPARHDRRRERPARGAGACRGRVGVITRRRGALPRYGFAHALIRETLYESMPSDVRMAWHRRVGEALERLHAGDLGPHLDELAHHFAHAASSDAAEKAIAYDARAAERASGMLAYEEAVRHLERALHAHALVAAPDAVAALALRLELGEMQAAAWANDAAKATFQAAAEQARRLGRPHGVARAALGVAGLGFGLPRGVVDAEIVALLEEALRGLPDDRSAVAARRRAPRRRAALLRRRRAPRGAEPRGGGRRRAPPAIRRRSPTSSTPATSRSGTRRRSRIGWRSPTRR